MAEPFSRYRSDCREKVLKFWYIGSRSVTGGGCRIRFHRRDRRVRRKELKQSISAASAVKYLQFDGEVV